MNNGIDIGSETFFTVQAVETFQPDTVGSDKPRLVIMAPNGAKNSGNPRNLMPIRLATN
jgi:hypothetical protein